MTTEHPACGPDAFPDALPIHRTGRLIVPARRPGRPIARPRWRSRLARLASLMGALALLHGGGASAATPTDLQAAYSQQAAVPADPARGEWFFNGSHGREWRCASCHGAVPTQAGKHAATGKTIAPLAPAFNPERFADAAKTEKWFRRNCNDVVGRECSAAEKADVLSWLRTLK